MKLLVCGTRKKGYDQLVEANLDKLKDQVTCIIEGCCPDSADAYAEEWAKKNDKEVKHFPGTPGNYLQRNVEMVEECTHVLAFWNGFSYGTAQAIAQGVLKSKKIKVIDIGNQK